jgi:hypothetical protein
MIAAVRFDLLMWTVPAFVGLVLAAVLWITAAEDRAFIRLRGNGRRQLLVTNLFVNESLRVVVQVLMLGAGLISMFLPEAPPRPYNLTVEFLKWSIISVPWLTMAQSAVSLYYRRRDTAWLLEHRKGAGE